MGTLFHQLVSPGKKVEKWAILVRNSRSGDSREVGNWPGYLFESGRTYSKKSRLDFIALRGKNWLESSKKKTLFCQPKNWKSRTKNGLIVLAHGVISPQKIARAVKIPTSVQDVNSSQSHSTARGAYDYRRTWQSPLSGSWQYRKEANLPHGKVRFTTKFVWRGNGSIHWPAPCISSRKTCRVHTSTGSPTSPAVYPRTW